MTTTADALTTDGAVTLVPIDLIRPNPRQVRRELKDIPGLADSIREVGLLEPVLLIPADDGEGFYLEAGHRRHAACRAAGLDRVRSIIGVPGSHAHQIIAMLVENGQREDLTPVEEARGYQAVLDLGEAAFSNPGKIAAAVGRSVKVVRQRVALTKLPEQVLDAVHRGQVTLETAGALTEFADDADATKRLTAALGTHNWNWTLSQEKDRRVRRRAEAKLRKELAAAGITVVDQPADFHTSQAKPLAWLTDQDGGALGEEAHQTCPHHAVYLVATGGGMGTVPLCLDPMTSGHRGRYELVPGAGGSAATTGEGDAGRADALAREKRREEERLEREERGRSLRSDFLLGLRVRDPVVECEVLRLYLSLRVPGYLSQRGMAGSYLETTLPDLRELAGILGVTLPVAAQKSKGTKAQAARDLEVARDSWDRFAPAIDEATHEQCVRALVSMMRRDLEDRLRRSYGDHTALGGAYVRFLISHGYQLSDEEVAMLSQRQSLHVADGDGGDGEGEEGAAGDGEEDPDEEVRVGRLPGDGDPR